MFGIPDYDEAFTDFMSAEADITGTDDLRVLRIEGVKAKGAQPENIKLHYKVDVRMDGYLPRSVLQYIIMNIKNIQ